MNRFNLKNTSQAYILQFNPGEVANTHYLYEVAWGISRPHGKETISFYI